jgi:hypothetical protein
MVYDGGLADDSIGLIFIQIEGGSRDTGWEGSRDLGLAGLAGQGLGGPCAREREENEKLFSRRWRVFNNELRPYFGVT